MSQQPPQRFMAGAVDLGEVKAQAESRARAASEGVATVISVTQATVTADVVERSYQVPVIVLVGSSRVPECAELHTTFTTLAEAQTSTEWVYGYLDADSSPQLAQALGIQAIPTALALAAGQPVADVQGAQPRDAITRWVQAVLDATRGRLEGLPAQNTQDEAGVDSLFVRARDALDSGDVDACLELVNTGGEAVQSDIRFARLRLRAARASEIVNTAAEILEKAKGNSTFAIQCDAGEAQVLTGQVDAGFDRLLTVIRTTTGDEKDVARRRLLALFELFEPDDSRVLRARRHLAAALY